jgi:hypothetical protein
MTPCLVDAAHLRVAGKPDPVQRQTAQESALWPSAAPGTAASAPRNDIKLFLGY